MRDGETYQKWGLVKVAMSLGHCPQKVLTLVLQSELVLRRMGSFLPSPRLPTPEWQDLEASGSRLKSGCLVTPLYGHLGDE